MTTKKKASKQSRFWVGPTSPVDVTLDGVTYTVEYGDEVKVDEDQAERLDAQKGNWSNKAPKAPPEPPAGDGDDQTSKPDGDAGTDDKDA